MVPSYAGDELPDSNPYAAPSRDFGRPPDEPQAHSKNWGLIVAILAGIALKVIVSMVAYFHPRVPLPVRLGALVTDVAIGAQFGISGYVLLLAVYRKQVRAIAPGHWLAVATLGVYLGDILSSPWRNQLGFIIGVNGFFMAQIVSGTVRHLFGAICFGTIGYFTTEPFRWKFYAWLCVFFYALSLLNIPLSLLYARGGFEFLSQALWADRAATLGAFWLCRVTFFILILGEVTSKVKRDRLHWSAIGLAFVAQVLLFFFNSSRIPTR